jgi:agmatine/peptidylarginine deiminase
MKKYYIINVCKGFFLFSLLLFKPAFSQNLPEYLIPQEKLMLHDYMNSFDNKGIITPPHSPVRNFAEWEEAGKLCVTWTSYTSVLTEIVRAARQECQVVIVCSDSTTVKSALTSSSVPLSNIKYIIAPYNSVWICDYFGNSVYTNDVDSLLLVDWIYNRPRPKDDTVVRTVAKKFNIPLYQTTNAPYKLVHTGGNYMSDGFGTAFSSNLILDDNSPSGGYGQNLTSVQIDTIMKKFHGIKTYIKMTDLPNDIIHHIDMHMKLLNEETLLVGQYPAGTSDGPQIEANLQYILANYNSKFGTPFKVIRIPMPPDPSDGSYPPYSSYYTYTNGEFVNKTYLMPIYNSPYDTTAYRIVKGALPGYKVVGIDCNDPINASGAIHCITHSIGSSDPLLISSQPLADTYVTLTPYTIAAYINHKSGIQTAEIYYSTDTLQPFQSVALTLTSASAHTWTGYIPAQPVGTTVYYYIEGHAVSGKSQVRPITAPTGYWHFKVLALVGIQESNIPKSIEMLQVFPNPASNLTCIPVESNYLTHAKIELFDVLGNVITTVFEGLVPKGKSNYFIEASKLSRGTYILKFTSDNKISTQMLIVK